MNTRWFLAVAAAFLAAVSVSCSGTGPGMYPVYGKVTYQGKPAKGASVHFHREGETAEEAANFPIGNVDEEGNFTLETAGVGNGAKPGKYKVLVLWIQDENPDGGTSAPSQLRLARRRPGERRFLKESVAEQRRSSTSGKDRLNHRYFHLDKPLLFAEVKSETNNLEPFELKD